MNTLCFAADPHGAAVPIIDVTHPFFAINASDEDISAIVKRHLRRQRLRTNIPESLQKTMLMLAARRSHFLRQLYCCSGGVLDAMTTYRMKLGPRNLDAECSSFLDRIFAATVPCLAMRLRLQDVAQLAAGHIAHWCQRHPKTPLTILNIGGGTAIDTINAAILAFTWLQKHVRPCQINILVLDNDSAGPSFGQRAIQTLTRCSGNVLYDTPIHLVHEQFDWQEPKTILKNRSFSDQQICCVMSEGALFEYGTDEQVSGILSELRALLPPEGTIVGSVARASAPGRMHLPGIRLSVRARSLETFTALVANSGWHVEAAVTRPLTYNVSLKPTTRA